MNYIVFHFLLLATSTNYRYPLPVSITFLLPVTHTSTGTGDIGITKKGYTYPLELAYPKKVCKNRLLAYLCAYIYNKYARNQICLDGTIISC